jgi:hypothetical protein
MTNNEKSSPGPSPDSMPKGNRDYPFSRRDPRSIDAGSSYPPTFWGDEDVEDFSFVSDAPAGAVDKRIEPAFGGSFADDSYPSSYAPPEPTVPEQTYSPPYGSLEPAGAPDYPHPDYLAPSSELSGGTESYYPPATEAPTFQDQYYSPDPTTRFDRDSSGESPAPSTTSHRIWGMIVGGITGAFTILGKVFARFKRARATAADQSATVPLTRVEKRKVKRQARRDRHRRRVWFEELLGWIFVPIIVFFLYWCSVKVLALFGMTPTELWDGLQQLADMLRARF